MELVDLLSGVAVKNGALHGTVSGLCFDSRKVARGDVFVATRGTAVDGHDFIDKAVELGATAVVCETLPQKQAAGVVYVQVENSAEALGVMAANFYGRPSHHLTLVGVTGDQRQDHHCHAAVSTFSPIWLQSRTALDRLQLYRRPKVEATHTTPDPLELNALLAKMVAAGCQYAFMECSSHAIDQRRIAGLRFRGGIFTNLTRDHMDYHKTVENYLKAKKRFFDDLPSDAFALTNADDKNGLVMLQNCAATKKTYSLRTMADFKTRILEMSFDGMLLEMNGHEVSLPFVGRFNASNLTAVFGAAVLLGNPEEEVLCCLSALHAVNGRFEALRAPQGWTAIVDYAHTPDALANVLATINDIRGGRGNLITVVGCGGNRDKGKRPMMAREAVNASSRTILTSDNPRDEEPQTIIDDMLARPRCRPTPPHACGGRPPRSHKNRLRAGAVGRCAARRWQRPRRLPNNQRRKTPF